MSKNYNAKNIAKTEVKDWGNNGYGAMYQTGSSSDYMKRADGFMARSKSEADRQFDQNHR